MASYLSGVGSSDHLWERRVGGSPRLCYLRLFLGYLYPLLAMWFRVVTVFLSEASLVGLMIRRLWRVLSSRSRFFRCWGKFAPKTVGNFWTLGAGLFSNVVFVVCLSPATQKEKFIVTLGLMEYIKHLLNVRQSIRSQWIVEWPVGFRDYHLYNSQLLYWLPCCSVPSCIPHWVPLWREWGY